ncbi:MAG: aminopeptidase, partial [Nitrosopumilaceae archaeon]|nr:aminopeptidase [Nitrosopumilaceae archaeon]
MKIKIEGSNPLRKKTEALCGFVLENSDKILGLNKINSKISESVKQSIKDINGEFGKISVIPTNNKIAAKRIIIAGIGKKDK